jgi:hypothetical protein
MNNHNKPEKYKIPLNGFGHVFSYSPNSGNNVVPRPQGLHTFASTITAAVHDGERKDCWCFPKKIPPKMDAHNTTTINVATIDFRRSRTKSCGPANK